MTKQISGVQIRPLEADDAEAATDVFLAALVASPAWSSDESSIERRMARLLAGEPTRAFRERFIRTVRRFCEEDPGGSWVAEGDDQVLGFCASLRRESFWGLAIFYVHPTRQGAGVGRVLLERAVAYGADASLGMIMSSTDPRALRRYSLAGFRLNPTFKAVGEIDRRTIPPKLGVRAGTLGDLPLVDAVDRELRRSSRRPDVEYMLSEGARLRIIDGAGARGYTLHFGGDPIADANPLILGAETAKTAQALLWDFLAHVDGPVELHGWTATQQWAIEVAHAARLQLMPDSALFLRGAEQPPSLWLPSGVYF